MGRAVCTFVHLRLNFVVHTKEGAQGYFASTAFEHIPQKAFEGRGGTILEAICEAYRSYEEYMRALQEQAEGVEEEEAPLAPESDVPSEE